MNSYPEMLFLTVYLAVLHAFRGLDGVELKFSATKLINLVDDRLWLGFVIAGLANFDACILMGPRGVDFYWVRAVGRAVLGLVRGVKILVQRQF